jgi:hypothetical protein
VGIFAFSHDLAEDKEPFCYFCIVLESRTTVLANGAVVSAINSGILNQLKSRCVIRQGSKA